MTKLFTLCAVLLAASASAQDLKHLDSKEVYAKNKVQGAQCVEVRFSGNQAVDTIPKGQADFDVNGRIIRYTEFFARGKKAAEFNYQYDERGVLVAASVSHRSTDFRPVALMMAYDKEGRVVSRTPVEPIAGMWQSERFVYNDKGTMVRAEQYFPDGQMLSTEYPATALPKENSLTWVYDQKGLLVTQQLFNNKGQVDRILVFKYH